jgi:pyruvate/2-oxoglutarate dehydrogenase complex dihydrolipoamide dehydrogenase (E3) component
MFHRLSLPTRRWHNAGYRKSKRGERLPAANDVKVARWRLDHVDRAVTDQDLDGFIKVIHRGNGEILGAQIVAARASEIIQEFVVAIDRRLKLGDLATSIHAYPTYATGAQQLAAEVRLESLARSRTLQLVRRLAGIGQS